MRELSEYLIPGEQVRITTGELAGWQGTITQVIDETVLVQLLNQTDNPVMDKPAWFIVSELELAGETL